MSVILLVEDDYALAMGTEYALQSEGYRVILAGTIEEARKNLDKTVDLILLDVMLPDGNGYDFCREVRRQNWEIPIIFLTAVSEEVNIVQGLDLGADDYIAKPYRVKELLSRIGAHLRRAGLHKTEMQQRTFSFGKHVFYVDDFRLLKEGAVVECTPSELRLLKELIQNEGQILSRNQLLERIYDVDGLFIDDNTLSVYMKRLRSKLGEDAVWIETVRGMGYRFQKQ